MSAGQRVGKLSRAKVRLIIASGGVAALAIVGMVGVGGTSALFSSKAGDQSASFQTGTVVLDNANTSQSTTCSLQSLAPGTLGLTPTTSSGNGGNEATTTPNPTVCSLDVKYTGSLRAWVLLDVSVTSKAAAQASATTGGATPGSEALYDGKGGLQLSVLGGNAGTSSFTQSNQVFSAGVPTCSTDASGLQTCTSTAADQVVAGPVSGGSSGVFHLDSYLPLSAGNQYQGSKATVTLTAHAVQYDNNHASDCYNAPCFVSSGGSNGQTANGDPMVTNVSVTGVSNSVSTATVKLTFNQALQSFSSSGPFGNFVVTDLSSTGTAPVTCPVTEAQLSSGTSGVSNNVVTLTLGNCGSSGGLASGSWMSFLYTSYPGSADTFLMNAKGTTYVPTEAFLAQAS